jgi:hypothetical protein
MIFFFYAARGMLLRIECYGTGLESATRFAPYIRKSDAGCWVTRFNKLTFRWTWNIQLLANKATKVVVQVGMARQNSPFAVEVIHVFIVLAAVLNKTTTLPVQVLYKQRPFHAKTSSSSSIISPYG